MTANISNFCIIAHVDHGLSEESERVAAHVAAYGSTLGYEVHLARAHDLEGPNLHERARRFRYAFFEDLAAREGARRVATAHTLDDRVETTLARLIHGAGLTGVAGLQPAEGVRVRPLIGSRRQETRSYCMELGIDFYDDPANLDVIQRWQDESLQLFVEVARGGERREWWEGFLSSYYKIATPLGLKPSPISF